MFLLFGKGIQDVYQIFRTVFCVYVTFIKNNEKIYAEIFEIFRKSCNRPEDRLEIDILLSLQVSHILSNIFASMIEYKCITHKCTKA